MHIIFAQLVNSHMFYGLSWLCSLQLVKDHVVALLSVKHLSFSIHPQLHSPPSYRFISLIKLKTLKSEWESGLVKKNKTPVLKNLRKVWQKNAQGNDIRQCRTEKHAKYTPDDTDVYSRYSEYSDIYSLNQLSVQAYERSSGISNQFLLNSAF